MRLIDADKLMEEISRYTNNVYGCDFVNIDELIEYQRDVTISNNLKDFSQGFCETIEIINEQPTIYRTETDWTLCSETLPKETGYYLIKNEANRIEYLWFMKSTNTWCLFNSTMEHNHVVKWKEVE